MTKKFPITIYESLLENEIRILGDSKLQKRLWLDGLGPEECTIEEVLADFLETTSLILESPEDFEGFDQKKIESLDHLYKMIHSYYQLMIHGKASSNIKNVLSSKEWNQVQNSAKRLYHLDEINRGDIIR